MRTKLWNGWEFCRVPLAEGQDPAKMPRPSAGFESVTVPHDWLIFNTEDLYADDIGYYRRSLNLAFEPSLHPDRYYLYFEGVYQDCTVYLNGIEVGQWKYGYSSFFFDLTPHLNSGPNILGVKVVHQSPNSRWYSGAGIYRPVWLIRKPPAHLAIDGIYVHSDVNLEDGSVRVDIEAEIKDYRTSGKGGLTLQCRLYDREKQLAGDLRVKPEHSGPGRVTFNVPAAKLWSPADPYLYELQVSLFADEVLLDQQSERIGFRKTEFNPKQGFLLNGEKLLLHGTCEHHTLGALGAAYHTAAARRQLEMLQAMGVNALRTAHNMPAPDLLDLCDELGILVINEAFDMWRQAKTAYDYARFFDAWSARDVASWVRRDRNHPSVIMWSLGNEIYDTHAGEEGAETMRYLMDEVAKHDPKQNAVPTFGSNYLAWKPTQKAADQIKLVGYNYAEKLYDEHHTQYPDWVIYGAETASVVQSRGIYHFPYELKILSDEDLQCSSLGNSPTSWGARDAAFLFEKEARTPYSMGQFIWTGFDYIGEPTPYHTKSSYFGQIDTAGFPKDSYYHFQAAWTDAEKQPMVHVYPHWDWNPGQTIDVLAVSNGAAAELFVNGESQGRQALSQQEGKVQAHWQVPYLSGQITCTAYDADGREIASAVQRSFGEPSRVIVSECPETLAPDDLLFVEIGVADKDGIPVANAVNRMQVFVEGAGQLIGLDNGDSTDFEPYKATHRRLFAGKLLAMIQPTDTGRIKVTIRSPELRDHSFSCLVTNTRNKAFRPMKPAVPKPAGAAPLDRPVRKLELTADAPFALSKEHEAFTVRAKAYPEVTDYPEILWQVTDARGVPSALADFEEDPADPYALKVRVKGDGRFAVRAMPYNGKDHPAFISMLTFDAEGFGSVKLDPYSFLSASLYTASNGEIGNGNERGISMMRDGKSWVAFEDLNFGAYGSAALTMPVFSFSDATPIRLWAGIPYSEGSEILYDDTYELPRIWNTYQDMHFTLSRRLRDGEVFAIEMESKAHIKGFRFKKETRAFSELQALEADRIYGDSFVKTEDAVEGIGNNVSLVFENLEFGDEGAGGITIQGRTPLEKNSVHLLIDTAEGQRRELLEFAGGPDYGSVGFAIERIRGTADITFVFLPGSNFDLRSFRFEAIGGETR